MDERIIRQLADPACYPGRSGPVTQYQTHLSLVCVVGDRAYKLKKSLRLPFADFSSSAKRLLACEEEVRLNARLCPDVYLGVVPLFVKAGAVSFVAEPGGEIIDHAVLMRRLPAERMMDVLLARDAVATEDIWRIADTIARFHRKFALAGGSIDALRAAGRLRDFALANFDETAEHCGPIFDRGLHQELRHLAEQDFEQHLPLLRKRAAEGRVVDGHGDLHARNICLGEPMAIYDCLEFSRELRVADVAAENAFFVMDLRYRSHPQLGTAYLDRYLEASGDPDQRPLIPMLLRYRAMVRAKVAAIGANEPEIDPADHGGLVRSARRHMNLMAAASIEQHRPWLICACGLPATGKSFVFEALQRASGWPCFLSDLVRKELAGIAPSERAPVSSYTPEASARTYTELLRRAAHALQDGPVLLDANFPTAALREQARTCARRAGAQLAFVWFHADDQLVEQRLRLRALDPDSVSDADAEVYRKLKAAFEPPTATGGSRLIGAPKSGDRDQQAAAILRQLMSPQT